MFRAMALISGLVQVMFLSLKEDGIRLVDGGNINSLGTPMQVEKDTQLGA